MESSESSFDYSPTKKSGKVLQLEKDIKNLQEQLELQRELDEIDRRRNVVLKKLEKY